MLASHSWKSLVLLGWFVIQYGCIARVVHPWDPTNTRQKVRPRLGVLAYCAWSGDGITPLPCDKSINRMDESVCPGERCNHVLARHQPNDPLQTGFDAAGYITDNWHDQPTFELPSSDTFYDECHTEPVMGRYYFVYSSGQAAGQIRFRVTFRTKPDCPRRGVQYHFLTREEDPASCCETVEVIQTNPRVEECTCEFTREVAYKDPISLFSTQAVNRLQELPPPPWHLANGRPAPYVRCGRAATCSPEHDTPYTWESHPSVHWGLPKMNEALQCLAIQWFLRCSKWSNNRPAPDELPGRLDEVVDPAVLAITDMSLPGGGLLDIDENWKPIATGRNSYKTWGRHKWHRHGTDADLVGVSLPPDGRYGPYLPSDTYDQKWMETLLWEPLKELADEEGRERTIFQYCGLKSFDNDPGHVQLEKSIYDQGEN